MTRDATNVERIAVCCSQPMFELWWSRWITKEALSTTCRSTQLLTENQGKRHLKTQIGVFVAGHPYMGEKVTAKPVLTFKVGDVGHPTHRMTEPQTAE